MQRIPKGIDNFKKIADITSRQARIHIQLIGKADWESKQETAESPGIPNRSLLWFARMEWLDGLIRTG